MLLAREERKKKVLMICLRRKTCVNLAGEPEIRDFKHVVFVDKNVAGLEIAMNNSMRRLFVQIVHALKSHS